MYIGGRPRWDRPRGLTRRGMEYQRRYDDSYVLALPPLGYATRIYVSLSLLFLPPVPRFNIYYLPSWLTLSHFEGKLILRSEIHYSRKEFESLCDSIVFLACGRRIDKLFFLTEKKLIIWFSSTVSFQYNCNWFNVLWWNKFLEFIMIHVLLTIFMLLIIECVCLINFFSIIHKL